jgi:uncharacterized damage-inducible protein DinB
MKSNTIADEFISQAIFRIEENTPRIKNCLLQLSDEEAWKKPNSSSNSVGNLILHLCGNITQYILSSLGGKQDIRVRDEEFSATGGFTRDELIGKITSTVNDAVKIIHHTGEKELSEAREVQGFNLSGIGIIMHVVEHYSYHTGQIALWTKILKDKDLGFYAGIDLNKKNIHSPH